jgi:hypothetical protein
MKALFLHGLESKPGGTKAKVLSSAGYEVFNPLLPRESFDESIRIAQEVIDNEQPDIVVGSSRGGAVGMCISTRGAPLVLIAPAWTMFLNPTQIAEWNIRVDAQKTIILHSDNDTIVLPIDSTNLMNEHGIKRIKVGVDHRMGDPEALEALLDVTKYLTK